MIGGRRLSVHMGLSASIQVGDILIFQSNGIQEKDIIHSGAPPKFMVGSVTMPDIDVSYFDVSQCY